MLDVLSRYRWREATGVTALAGALTVVLTYPVAFELDNAGRLETGDGRLSIWNVAWVARALVTDPLSLYDANIFYPHRNTLAFSETNLGAGVLAVPAYWLTGSAFVAHNVVLLVSFVLAAVAAYYLARYLTGSSAAAVAASVGFAFNPYIFARLPHIQLLMTAGLPLSLLAFHRLVDRPTLGRASALGVALAAQALMCGYYGIFAGLTVGLGVIFYALTRHLWRDPRYWLAVFVAAALSVLLVFPFLLPYLELRGGGALTRTLGQSRQYAADWRSYLASGAHLHRWILPLIGQWNEVLFPGFLLTILGLTGLWSSTTGGAKTSHTRDAAIFYALVAALAFWISLGPDAGLYGLLYQTVPLLSLTRAPSRFGLMVTLSLAMLAALAIRDLAAKAGRFRRALPALATCLIVVEFAQMPVRWDAAPPTAAIYRLLVTLPRGPVIELPYFWEPRTFHSHTEYMLNSTYHWFPLINGYSDHIPQDFREEAPILRRFPTPESFPLLKARGARYAIFHVGRIDPTSTRDLVTKIERYPRELKPIFRSESVWLYEIVAWPEGRSR